MSQPTIILTGFMATGKSTVGRIVAELSGRTFIDTDELIESRTGRSTAEIFEQDGETYFRQQEATVARELRGRQSLVVATGGRLMLDPLNALFLGRDAFVVCLTAKPEEIVARVAGEHGRRPLLKHTDYRERVLALLDQRSEQYEQFSQLSTDGKESDLVARQVLDMLEEWKQDKAKPRASRLTVRYPGGRYFVHVGRGLLPMAGQLAGIETAPAIITDNNVGPLYTSRLGPLHPFSTLTIQSGETYKTLDTVANLYKRLLKTGMDRHRPIFSLGGGVVGDIAGFVAATYMRGVPLVQCPTSLLAMVDASVGGKTGVDMKEGKNLVGAFKQPVAVVADLDTLNTLPSIELSAGLAEVVKHALIASPELFADLERASWTLADLPEDGDLQTILVEAIQIKRDVVEVDPYEGGRRMILNLGHTFAHAIERVSRYGISHGHAVAMGLAAAARLSRQLGDSPPDLTGRIVSLLGKLGLPSGIPSDLHLEEILAAMNSDKKRKSGKNRFVLLSDIGHVYIAEDVPEIAVRYALTNAQT